MLKLYDCAPAPSPRRARFLLAEKSIDYETIQIDLQKGEQLSEAYKAINPRCTVPALITEHGQLISENIAIAAYLEALQPEPCLMGKSALQKARILEWNWRCEFEGLLAVAEILRNSSKAMQARALPGPHNYEQIPALAERGRQRLKHFFQTLNKQLATHDFVAGDDFSLADITAVITMDFSRWVKAWPDESLEPLQQWHQKISTRPAYST